MPGGRFGQFAARIVHGPRLSQTNRFGPLQPTHTAVGILQGHEESKIFQPLRPLGCELFEGVVENSAAFRREVFPGLCQKPLFPVSHPAENDAVLTKWSRGQIIGHQQSVLHQKLRADQERIARKS